MLSSEVDLESDENNVCRQMTDWSVQKNDCARKDNFSTFPSLFEVLYCIQEDPSGNTRCEL